MTPEPVTEQQIECRTSGSTVTARAFVAGQLLERRLDRACEELEFAFYAQARRRFGSCFARGEA